MLSDSGIGREMHVIVGQGKLNEILESRPEDRRAFIEEAAGVLKHRKRKEKAVRKLESMSANLARLTDLTTELRRQLKPLGRQAEVARRAQTIQADLRDARLRLAADDVVTRQSELNNTNHAEATLRREHDEASARMAVASEELAAHEEALTRLSERAERAQQTWFRLSALAERVSATVRIASERAQHLDVETASTGGPDPDELEAQAEQVAAAERQLLSELAATRSRLDAARAELADRERDATEAEQAHVAACRPKPTAARAWPGWPDRWRRCGRVSSRSTTVSQAVGANRGGCRPRAAGQGRVRNCSGPGRRTRQGEVGLDEHHDRTVAAMRSADERVAELQAAERGADVRSRRSSRIDALSVGLERKTALRGLLKTQRAGGGGGRGGGGGGGGRVSARADRRRASQLDVEPRQEAGPRRIGSGGRAGGRRRAAAARRACRHPQPARRRTRGVGRA